MNRNGIARTAYVVVGLALSAAYFVLPGVLAPALLYSLVGLLATVAVIVGTRINRSGIGWYLFAATLFLWTAGDTVSIFYEPLIGRPVPYPSVADVLYLAGYPLAIAGIFLYVRARVREPRAEIWLDAAVVGLLLGLAAWTIAAEPYLTSAGLDLSQDLVGTAYILADVVLLAGIASLLNVPRAGSPANVGLMVAVGVTLLADAFYNVDLMRGTYSAGAWYESFYLVSYVIWGYSALHPSSGGPPIDPSERITARRPLLLIIGADLVLVACLTYQIARGHEVPLPPLVALGALAFTLTVVRMERMVSVLRAEVARSRASEAESRQMQKQLREAEKMEAVGQLAGGVAHDFNNLLSVIQNYAYFVLDSLPEDDERREDLWELIAAGERGAELVRQLLTFSRRDRSEVGRIELDPTVEEISKLLRRTISESISIELDLRVPGSVVELDRAHLEQMILNLALNAQDAMPTGGTLTISTEARRLSEDEVSPGLRPGDHVRICVRDTGWGIPEAVMDRIFEPFFTTKERGSGTGLGLASLYGSVTRSGGSVSVESVVDVGTTFEILLPTVPVRLVPAVDEPEPRSGPLAASILVAEDEPEIRQIVKRILETSGYRVTLSESPYDALKLVQEGDGIDLLLTDVVMPGMSGQELADRALQVKPDLRCLFMSGYSEEIQARHGVRLTEFLPKPFTSDRLLEAVDRALRT